MPYAALQPFGAVLIVVVLLTGCDDQVAGPVDAETRAFTFEESAEGWTGDFVDYETSKTPEELELEFDRRPLPPELDENEMGLYFAGLNESDDLFMYGKHELTGLEPSTTYRVGFRLAIASNSPSNCVGIGGPPGEAVRVKVGASNVEPTSVVEGGIYRLNIDKDVNDGERADSGAVREIGNVANGVEQCTGEVPYRMITLANLGEPFGATTSANGSLWIFVGTDSGFEGKTTLYYDTIEVSLEP